NFIRMQFWLLAISATAMTLGAMLSEQRALNERLIEANEIAVTALQKAENLRMSAEAAARSKTLFLANMSHELRTPLNAIIGFSDIIKSGLFGPVGSSKYSEYASDIYASGKHLLSVISDVLDMSKIEAGKIELNPEPSDLCALIRFSTHTVETNAENIGITLITKIPRHPVLLNVDPRAIKQILLNLLSNAIKFTPKGGEVIVRLVHDEKGTSIEIEDTGIGIPLDQLPLLGKPFVQLKNDPMTTHEGTGLGLALARSLTEGHGGSLLIESALSRGTKVTVFLPVAIEYEQAKQLG
ncbi:MAG: HAMP domain-containing sensor histidine kinase, partial [Parvibaculum sp.]|nr:HAMP domain-containing sensor histidine kinase [Parvibaculum sp.]